VLEHTVPAIWLTLALTISPATFLQTPPPGPANNPVRTADATAGWIVASGRDRSPTFDALVGRLAHVDGLVVVCWSGRQARAARAELPGPGTAGNGRHRVVYVVLADAGDTENAIVLLGQELQIAVDTLEGRPPDAAAAARAGHAIRRELKPGT
jgi:hypothetical protein